MLVLISTELTFADLCWGFVSTLSPCVLLLLYASGMLCVTRLVLYFHLISWGLGFHSFCLIYRRLWKGCLIRDTSIRYSRVSSRDITASCQVVRIHDGIHFDTVSVNVRSISADSQNWKWIYSSIRHYHIE